MSGWLSTHQAVRVIERWRKELGLFFEATGLVLMCGLACSQIDQLPVFHEDKPVFQLTINIFPCAKVYI